MTRRAKLVDQSARAFGCANHNLAKEGPWAAHFTLNIRLKQGAGRHLRYQHICVLQKG